MTAANRHRVMLGLPGPRPDNWAIAAAAFCASDRHEVLIRNSPGSGDNFNFLWVLALNAAHRGEITHFAMMHQDVEPPPGWLDVLLEELDARDADFISAAVLIKSEKQIYSCGVMRSDRPEWNFEPFRRFTAKELREFPPTFSAADIGYPQAVLAHNDGLWAADLRKPVWRTKTEDGRLRACFDFRREIREAPDGTVSLGNLSEDYAFSEEMGRMGVRSLITRRLDPGHWGAKEYRSDPDSESGVDHDELTRAFWVEPAK